MKKTIIFLFMMFKISGVLPAGSPPSTLDRLLSSRSEIKKSSEEKTKAALESYYEGEPLHLAVIHGCAGVIGEFIDEGFDVNALDPHGQTPLHWAARMGHVECVGVLLENRAEINRKNDYGNTPLHLAALYGHEACVDLLLQYGADRSIKNGNADRPIDIASRLGYDVVYAIFFQERLGPLASLFGKSFF